MTTCLILAAGDAERHNGGNKPLLKVNGETLLDRTWRLLEEHPCERWLVTHNAELEDLRPVTFRPVNRRWIVETLLSTRPLWNENHSTIVVLGDVYYTDYAVSEMFNDDLKYAAFGRGCNIHGLRWNSSHNAKIASELARSVKSAEDHPQNYGAGKLWTFVACCQPEIPVIDFGDETTDFDSPQEHQRFIAKYGNRNR